MKFFLVICCFFLAVTCDNSNSTTPESADLKLTTSNNTGCLNNGTQPLQRRLQTNCGSTSTTRHEQLMQVLAARRRELHSRFQAHLKTIEQISRTNRPQTYRKNCSRTPGLNCSTGRINIKLDIHISNNNLSLSQKQNLNKKKDDRVRTTGKINITKDNDVLIYNITSENGTIIVKSEINSNNTNDVDDILQTQETNHGLFILNSKTHKYKSPNDSVQPNSNEVLNLESQTEEDTKKTNDSEYDLSPYLYFGQKLHQPKINDTKNIVINSRYQNLNSRNRNGNLRREKEKEKERDDDNFEIMDVSSVRTSVERNKVRNFKLPPPSRHIALFNNFYRKPMRLQEKLNTTTSQLEETNTVNATEIPVTNIVKRQYKNETEEEATALESAEKIKLFIDSSTNVTEFPNTNMTTTTTTEEVVVKTTSTTTESTTESFKNTVTEDIPSLTTINENPEETTTEFLIIIPSAKMDYDNITTDEMFDEISTEIKTESFTEASTPIPSSSNIPSSSSTTSTTISVTTAKMEVTELPKVQNKTTTATTEVEEDMITDNEISTTVNNIFDVKPFEFNNTEGTTVITVTNQTSIVINNVSKVENVSSLTTSTEDPLTRLNTVVDKVLLRHNNDVVVEIQKINIATYVLAGLGTFPIIVILIYVIKAIYKRKNKESDELKHYIKDNAQINPVAIVEEDEKELENDDNDDAHEYLFDRTNLRFKSILGEGNFGQVWKAEADDLSGHLGTTRIVAVKAERDIGGAGLKDEATIMKKLGTHPNVVTLLGTCMEKEPHLLIMEFAMRGRLLSLLRACRGIPEQTRSTLTSSSSDMSRTPPLSSRQMTGFAHDIARGMEYISSKNIVHRDLAARNVLIDHNGICKICDFGMSIDVTYKQKGVIQKTFRDFESLHKAMESPRSKSDLLKFGLDCKSGRPDFKIGCDMKHSRNDSKTGCDNKSRPALPIRWMAPESLQMHVYNTETDMWAFGVVIWEIFTLGCTPYPSLTGREVVRLVPAGLRLERPRQTSPEIHDLLAQTWRTDPKMRPTFTEARHELARILREDTNESECSDYFDVSGFSEDFENGMIYFNRRISEFECDI